MSPFEAGFGEYLRLPLDVTARGPGRKAVAASFATKMNDILQQLTDWLKVAQLATIEEAFANARHFSNPYCIAKAKGICD